MEDVSVLLLAAVSEIEEDCELFQNPEDISLCNDFIPWIDEGSDCSDSNDAADDDFYNDEVVGRNAIVVNVGASKTPTVWFDTRGLAD